MNTWPIADAPGVVRHGLVAHAADFTPSCARCTDIAALAREARALIGSSDEAARAEFAARKAALLEGMKS